MGRLSEQPRFAEFGECLLAPINEMLCNLNRTAGELVETVDLSKLVDTDRR